MALKMIGAYTYAQLKDAGWSDDAMVQHGHAVEIAEATGWVAPTGPITVSIPLAALAGENHIPAGNTVNRRLVDAGIPTVGHFGVLYVTRGTLSVTLDGESVLYQWKP